MSTIVPYVMREAGYIPGLDGYFAAGQTVFVDVDDYTVVRIETPEAGASQEAEQNTPLEAPPASATEITGG